MKIQPALSLLSSPTGGLWRVQEHLVTHDIPLESLFTPADEIEVESDINEWDNIANYIVLTTP